MVLLREPASAFWSRFGYRLVMAAALGYLAAALPAAWISVPLWVFSALMAVLAVLAVVNIAKNRRALLVRQGSGSIEWPRSIQEIVLRRPLTWVAGPVIDVTYPPVAALPAKTDPRITLSDGERAIERVPLYGADARAWVERANAALTGSGTTLRYVERDGAEPTEGGPAEGEE